MTWLFYGAFYLTRFNFSPVIPLLRTDLDISNAQAGGLMSFFFLTYTVFQLPAGYTSDRFGPRRVLFFGALVSIAGNLMFSRGVTYAALAVAQLVNGAGQAVGWSSAVKMIVNWFPRSRRGTAIGLFATCVTGGSSLAIQLSGFLADNLGWRASFVAPSMIMAGIGLLFFMRVKDHPSEVGLPDFEDEAELEKRYNGSARSQFKSILSNRNLWVVAVVYFFFVYVQFGCLIWIPTFLVESYTLSVNTASTITFVILLPGVVASPLGGLLSDRVFKGRRKPLLAIGMAVLSAANCMLFFDLRLWLAGIVLAFVGLMILMPDVLLAAFPSDIFSRKLSGTAMGFLATFTSASGIVTTPLSGKIADLFQSYGAVFLSFGIVASCGMILTLFIHEKIRP